MSQKMLCVVALVSLAACGGGGVDKPVAPPPPPPPPPAPVATVTISPATVTLTLTQTSQLTAATLDANGGARAGRTVTWSSGSANVATVNSSGLVTAVAAGTAQISATSEGKTGTASVVVQLAVARVGLDTTARSMVPGESAQLRAIALSDAGDSLQNRPVAWTSGTAAGATISAAGLLTAVAPGTTVVTATVEGKTATKPITVRDGGLVGGTGTSVINGASGALRIEVPAGAAPAGLKISVDTSSTLPAALPERSWAIGKTLYKLGPDGTQFASPVTVTMTYDPATLPGWVLPGDLGMQRWDGAKWQGLTNVSVDTAKRTISGQTMGFSTFGFIGSLPPAVITPSPGSVNYNQRFVDFTASVPGHAGTNFLWAWSTTGSNGSIITSAGNTGQYASSSPVLPEGALDLVTVDVSAPVFLGGPYIPMSQATAKVDSKLALSFEYNPPSQKLPFDTVSNLQVLARNPDGTIYQSPDLFFEYDFTTYAGDVNQAKGVRVQDDRPTYTTWPAKQQVPLPPRGEKLTVTFSIR